MDTWRFKHASYTSCECLIPKEKSTPAPAEMLICALKPTHSSSLDCLDTICAVHRSSYKSSLKSKD